MMTKFKTKTFITNGVCFRTKQKKKMPYENKKHVNLQRRFTYLCPKKLCRRALLDYLHPLMWSSIYPLSSMWFNTKNTSVWLLVIIECKLKK